MPKRKDALSLFEVMGRPKPPSAEGQGGQPVATQSQVNVNQTAATPVAARPAASPQPPQQQPTPQPASVPPIPRQAPPAKAPLPPAKAFTPPAVPGGAKASAARPSSADPVFASDGQRYRVSLGVGGWAIAAGAVLLAVAGSFWAGRMTAKPSWPTQTVANTGGPADQRGQANVGGSSKVLPIRTPDKHYLVIQGLEEGLTPARLKDAEEIVKFLDEKGEQATVERYPANSPKQYVVMSLTPIDGRDEAAQKAYAVKIQDLGQEYKKAGGRYDFRQTHGAWYLLPQQVAK